LSRFSIGPFVAGWPTAGARSVWDSTPAGRGRVSERVIDQRPGEGQTLAVEDPRVHGTQEVRFAPVEDGTEVRAINDVVVARKGAGQVKTEVRVDDEVYVRLAGDGVVVATAKALAERGTFADDESVVLYITGNAYKGTIARAALGPVVAADADEFRAAYAEALA